MSTPLSRVKPQRQMALAAAALMTALAVGSQVGLAEYYTAQTDALLAAQRASAPVAAAAPAIPRPRS